MADPETYAYPDLLKVPYIAANPELMKYFVTPDNFLQVGDIDRAASRTAAHRREPVGRMSASEKRSAALFARYYQPDMSKMLGEMAANDRRSAYFFARCGPAPLDYPSQLENFFEAADPSEAAHLARYDPEVRKNAEELRKYLDEADRSEGFDITTDYGRYLDGGLVPHDPNTYLMHNTGVKDLAKFAVSQYNQHNRENLKLLHVLKLNTQVVSGSMYYLTLLAQDRSSSEVNTYQAKVWRPVKKEWSLEVFRLAPQASSASASASASVY